MKQPKPLTRRLKMRLAHINHILDREGSYKFVVDADIETLIKRGAVKVNMRFSVGDNENAVELVK